LTLESVLAGKWIAGPDIGHAINKTREINGRGCNAIVNYLGEDLTDSAEIEESTAEYMKLIEAIKAGRLWADISVKASQIGLAVNEELAITNYSKIVGAARNAGIFVWLDMESYSTVDSTIKIYETQVKSGGVGIAIQSYLKRSNHDAEMLVDEGGIIRLVKGAYKESHEIAYTEWKDKTDNFRKIMSMLFEKSSTFTVATHDLELVNYAINLNKKYKRDVTVAMLLGIRNKYLYELARTGFKCALYVPYGRKWIDYASRRLREVGNVYLVLRSIMER
jgi:proline dehydrogenase